MDPETLASQVFPYVKGAISAYGQAVLTQTEDAAASGTVRLGQRVLAAVLRRGRTAPQVEDAVRGLAATPEDPGAAGELHGRIRQALQEDPGLTREVAAMMNIRVSSFTVTGHHNVSVGGDHQGPIHMGDNTSNTHHNVHHTVHNTVHERKISGFSIAALVLGLLGFLVLPIPFAIVFGLLALTRVLRSPSQAQIPGADQAGGGASAAGGPSAAGPREAMTGPAGPTGKDAGAAANSTPPPTEPAWPSGPAADPAAGAPDGRVGEAGPSGAEAPSGTDPAAPFTPDRSVSQTDPSGSATPPGADPAAPITPDRFAGQAEFHAGVYPQPAPTPGAAGPPFTPPLAEASAPFVPAAGSGFAAAKAISVVFSLVGLLTAGMWGLGWTAAAVIVAQADSGSYASEDTDLSIPGTLPSASGEGEGPSPVDLCEPSPGYATVCTLETGDCFIDPATAEFYEVELTSCDEPHNAQVIGSYSPSGSDWPGEAAFTADIDATCSPMSESALDPARMPDTYFVGYIAPNEESWDYGIQEAFCYVAADGESWTTSLTW
ncbi:hypothetical protein GCM10009551_033060 [Nocardiopsis tropica]|uniref:septum formation family protein n=1 Tax=Nocardiopsis tropica TaxID=109330 RepID=UPI0031E22A1D